MRPEKRILVVLCGVLMLALAGGMAYAQSITVTSPSAGVTWHTGHTYNITWTTSGISGDEIGVRIRLRDSSSDNVVLIIADDIPIISGSYSWTIPNTVEPGNYVIRVRTAQVIGDSAVFSIDKFALARIPEKPVKVAAFPKIVVCVTSGKEAPINRNRDIHVWIKNEGARTVRDLTLVFSIGGKGTTTHHVQELIPLAEHRETRRHSWSTKGNRKITAQLSAPSMEPIVVTGFINIHLPAVRFSQTIPGLQCSDGRFILESSIKDLPKPEEDPLDLLVCASDGKNPPINAKRDIHVWIKNTSGITYENLLLEFYVQQRGTTTHKITALSPGQELKYTRNHSWGTVGDKKIMATVFSSGRSQQVSVESSFRVALPAGSPTSSAQLNVRCSDGSRKKESDF